MLVESLGAPTVEGLTRHGLMPLPVRGRSAGSPGVEASPPPWRERGGAQAPPEAPGTETTTAQEGEASGEVEVEVEERGGPAQAAAEMEAEE